MLTRTRQTLARWQRSALVTRIRGMASRARDMFPLTPLGLAVGLASYAVLQAYGYRLRDLVLFTVGGLGVGLVALALLVTVIGTVLVWRSTRRLPALERRRLECNRWSPTGFVIPSRWYVPLLTVDWGWQDLSVTVRRTREGNLLREEVRPRRRAETSAVTRRFEIGDAFGLARIAFESRQPCDLTLLPSVGALRQTQVIHGIAGGGDRSDLDGKPEGDPFDTRRYAPGDPIRFVLWKVFAKSRQLIVRTPERAVSPTEQTIAYVVTGRDDEPSAGAARLAVDVGAFGDGWRIGADGVSLAARTRDEALTLLTRSARATESQSGTGLAHFVDEAGALGRLVVFVPPHAGPWLTRVRQAVRELKGRVDFVIGTDGIDRSSRIARALELAEDESEGHGVPLHELAKVVRALGSAVSGSRIVVVDRRTGHAFLPEHLFGGRSR